MGSNTKKLSVFYGYKFLSGIWPLGPLMIIFLAQVTGSYSKAGLAYAITFLTQSLLEIPTSIVSDKHSRKANLLASTIIFFIASSLWSYGCYFSSALPIYIGCFLSGVSASLASGTDKALLYEYLKEDDEHSKYNIYSSEYHKYNQLGMVIGLILGVVALRYYDISSVVYLSCLFAFFRILFVIVMPKQKERAKSKLNNFGHFISAFKKIIKRKKLRNMGAISVFNYVGIQTSHRFEALYFATFFSDSMILVIRFFKHVCGYISFAAIKHLGKFNAVQILLKSSILTFITRIIGWLVNSPFIISSSHLFYGGTESSKDKILQDLYSNKERATLDSILAFFNTLVGSAVLVFASFLADVFSPKIAMLLFIAINLIVWIGYNTYFKKNKY